MTKHKKQILFLRYYLLGKGYHRALDALEYGLSIHVGTRKDGVTPEYQHQVEIVMYITTILSSLMYPEDTIIAALLHDTPEDYFIDHRYIAQRFGNEPGEAIYLLDKNGKTAEQYHAGIAGNAIASIVKGADRMHNVGSMVNVFKREKQIRYTDEVVAHYLPMLKIARRKFPQQTDAYENIKHILNIQLSLFHALHQSNDPAREAATDDRQFAQRISTSEVSNSLDELGSSHSNWN